MIHTCSKQNLKYFIYTLGEVFLQVQFISPMGLYTPQSNQSSWDHPSDPLWYLIHAVRTLAVYIKQVRLIRCGLVNFVPRIVGRVPFYSETVSALFYYTDEYLYWFIICCITNFETFSQFVRILRMIICNNIITDVWLLFNLWFKYWFVIMSIIKVSVVNVI